MISTQCDLTNEQGECTIEQGIVGCDGVRRGAVADIDLFSAFNMELSNGSDMWENKLIRDKVVINRQAAATIQKRSVEQLSMEYEAAFALMAEDGINPNEEGAGLLYSPFDLDNE